jgi:bile acid:Na+ symporter, BASS family
LTKILNNRTFILVLAFVAGLIFSDLAGQAGVLTMPALAVVLTVSTTQVTLKDFSPLTKMIRPVVLALLLNYLLLGSIILLLAWWLMPTRDLWIGYVLVAAAPPGIAIIPFTYILKGNLTQSMLGTFGVYLLSLLLTPALIYLFTGEAAVSPLRLFNTMLLLILVPFIFHNFLLLLKLLPTLTSGGGLSSTGVSL